MKARLLLIILLISITLTTFSQQNPTWDKWEFLFGNWIGEGSGQPGEGEGTFSFSLDLDKKILVRKSHSEYPATEKTPETIHDDLMIVYLNQLGDPSNAIYFDNEGHVIEYKISYQENKIILTSNKISNVPIFRLSYTLLDNNTVNTKFEMSQDEENFITYIEGKSIRL